MNVNSIIDARTPAEPTELQKLTFGEYARAVAHPGSILEDLQAGHVSDETMETWETLYPEELEELRTMLADEVSVQVSAGREFDQLEIRNLNKVMGSSDDGYTMAMQRAYETPEEMSGMAGAAPNMASAMPTGLDRAINRDIGG